MTDSNGVQAYMPVGPANFGGYGDGMFGGNGAWWIIILLAVLGWGNGFGGMGLRFRAQCRIVVAKTVQQLLI